MSNSIDPSAFLIKIWDATAGELKHLRRPKRRIEQLKEASDDLETKAADINSKIIQAKSRGQDPTNQIQRWMTKVTKMRGEVEATEQAFKRRRCLAGWSWNCISVNRSVDKSMEEIKTLMTQVDDSTQVAIETPPPAVVQMHTSNSALWMDANMNEVLNHIANTNAAGIIGIYGMGGAGKTTLLRNINNHKDVEVFDHVIWAVASKECQTRKLQKDVATRIHLQLEEHDTEDGYASKIFGFLKNKDCLLLLDDLWEPLDLAMLGMVHVSQGQGEHQKRKVVLFTTRDKEVCTAMRADKKVEIKCLEQKQAWELFKMNAGEEAIGSNAAIDHIGRQIAKECAGLPLALVTVAKAMSAKKSWEAWNDALTQMKQSQLPELTRKKEADPMYSAFKLSYDSLEDNDMRDWLLSCAMWPEDHLIRKDELIECWIGFGLINEVGAIHKAYNRGHSQIEILIARCLLQPAYDKKLVQMHDVIRDMALWIASDCGFKKFKWIVSSGFATSQALEEKEWHEAERASLMHYNITSLPNQLSTCSKLSVLMLRNNYPLREIHGSLIEAMHSLTYMDLENTAITVIPKEIGMLSQLRHLNLSCTRIKDLPAELGCLHNLNNLLLRRMLTYNGITVAKGAISNLSSLRFLDLTESNVNCYDELVGLERCQISINVCITKAVDLKLLCSLPHVSIWHLDVEELWDSTNPNQLLDEIMESRNTKNMEKLGIAMVQMNKLLISEGDKDVGGLQSLKCLYLSSLIYLEEITWQEVQPQVVWKRVQPQVVFSNLRELSIIACRRLRNVNWTLQLRSLSVLEIRLCDMEELISDESNSGSSSFGLRTMTLYGLHKLKSISSRPLDFPYLEKIQVNDCPLLRKLPFDHQILVRNKLKAIECEQTWWDNLEWEEVSTKHLLSRVQYPLFRSLV